MKNTELKNRLFIKFDQLTFDVANRKINSKQVEILKESVLNYGVLRPVVVVFLKGKKIVVDGQHLATALHELKMPIECAVVPCENDNEKIELMSYLNRIANKWTTSDYINAYKQNKNKHYVMLSSILVEAKKIRTKYLQINPCLLFSIYSGEPRVIATKKVENGSFEIKNKKKGDLIIERIYDLQKNGLKSGLRQSEGLFNLMNERGSEYNHSLMIKRFKASSELKDKINSLENVKEITNLLSDVYDNTTNGIPKLKKAA